jgi:hypothetical protein
MNKNKNCIMMVAIDDELSKHSHKKYSDLTIKSWEFYCKRYNIDFHIVREKRKDIKHSVFHKEFVFDYIGESYNKIGIVDFDTMVKWDSPNVFELYDDEFVGIMDNASIWWFLNSINAYKSNFKELSSINLKISENINGGVLFFTNKHKNFFDKIKKFYFSNKNLIDNWNIPNTGREQTILNLFLKKENIKRKFLPYAWNTVGMIKRGMLSGNEKLNDPTPLFLKYGYIWHFTGFPIEKRSNLISQIWNQTKNLYK